MAISAILARDNDHNSTKLVCSHPLEHTDSGLKAPNGARPRIKYKRSRIVFAVSAIALNLGRPGTLLLGIDAQSPTGSPGTFLKNADDAIF